MSAAPDRGDVERALEAVLDPCMTAAGLELSILDLGLVREIRMAAGGIEIEMTFTEPGCPFTHRVLDRIHRVLGALPGTGAIRVTPVWTPPWTPADMRPEARRQLEASRRRLITSRAGHRTVIPIQDATR